MTLCWQSQLYVEVNTELEHIPIEINFSANNV